MDNTFFGSGYPGEHPDIQSLVFVAWLILTQLANSVDSPQWPTSTPGILASQRASGKVPADDETYPKAHRNFSNWRFSTGANQTGWLVGCLVGGQWEVVAWLDLSNGSPGLRSWLDMVSRISDFSTGVVAL